MTHPLYSSSSALSESQKSLNYAEPNITLQSSFGWDPEKKKFRAFNTPPEWLYLLESDRKQDKEKCSNEYGKIFGRHLQDVIAPERQLPDVVFQCITWLESKGLNTNGLFIKRGDPSRIQDYVSQIDAGWALDLSEETDPHVVAGLLKKFLHSMPEPICTMMLWEKFLSVADMEDPQERLVKISHFIPWLPTSNRNLARFLLAFINRLSQSDSTGLTSDNLCIIFGPSFFLPINIGKLSLQDKMDNMVKVGTLMMTFFENFDFLFSNYSESDALHAPSQKPQISQKTPVEIVLEKSGIGSEKVEKYAQLLQENDITVDLMADFNECHLKDVGIASLGDRMQILRAIKSINNASDASGDADDAKKGGKNFGIKSTISGKIQIKKELGSGNFSTVYLGIWESSTVACKKLQSFEVDLFKAEANILTKLQHPNVIHYMGIWSASSIEHYMVMEYIAGGSLEKLIADTPLTPRQFFSIARQTAAGLAYLHSKEVLHRDLACRNLLVSADSDFYRIKVSDFGLSKTLYGRDYYVTDDNHFARKWASPEACLYNRFSKASDVWSLGTTIWEIYSKGMVPWGAMTNKEAVQAMSDGEKLAIPAGCPQDVYDEIMMPCWRSDPKKRPSVADLLQVFERLDVDDENQPEAGEDLDTSDGDESDDEYTY